MVKKIITASEAYAKLRPKDRKNLKGLVKQTIKNAKNVRTETLTAKLEAKHDR